MKINDVQVWHFTGGNKKIYDCVTVVSYHALGGEGRELTSQVLEENYTDSSCFETNVF